MKIVIVANTIFPHNQPRAFRATELAKQMAKLGHDVHLYGILGTYDYSSFEEKYNLKVHNIGPMKFIGINSDGKKQSNRGSHILGKLFGRVLAYPQIEFVPKIHRIIKHRLPFDLLITLAPFHAIHWGAALSRTLLKNQFPNVWIADCGDPFMGRSNSPHPFYFNYLEKWTFSQADAITIPVEMARKAYFKEFHQKIHVIPQGFNLDENVFADKKSNNRTPTFIYAGALYKNLRDPSSFLEYLTTLKTPFLFKIYTNSDDLIAPFKNRLKDKVEINPFIPREKLLREMHQADFLVNFQNNNSIQSPSKLIDYSITKRPILDINPANLAESTIDEFLKGDYTHQLVIKDMDQYRIENVARKFIKLFEALIN